MTGPVRSSVPAADVVAAARRWIGTPYHDQASVRDVGCDCLGLVRGIWRELIGPEPETVPPYSRSWGETGEVDPLVLAMQRQMVPAPALVPGAVLLFRMRRQATAKHLGIMVTPVRFVHSYERQGVVEMTLTGAWSRRVAAVFLYPEKGPN